MTEHEGTDERLTTEEVSQSKRRLLKAGWVAPAVMVLTLPAVSFDANASGGGRPIEPLPSSEAVGPPGSIGPSGPPESILPPGRVGPG